MPLPINMIKSSKITANVMSSHKTEGSIREIVLHFVKYICYIFLACGASASRQCTTFRMFESETPCLFDMIFTRCGKRCLYKWVN